MKYGGLSHDEASQARHSESRYTIAIDKRGWLDRRGKDADLVIYNHDPLQRLSCC